MIAEHKILKRLRLEEAKATLTFPRLNLTTLIPLNWESSIQEASRKLNKDCCLSSAETQLQLLDMN